MRLILMDSGLDISTTEDDKYNFVIKIAKGESKFDDIIFWIQNNLIK